MRKKTRSVNLPDGTSVEIQILPRVGRKRKTFRSKEYSGRKTVYGNHIPVVRRKAERKSRSHYDSGLDTNLESRVRRANAERKHAPSLDITEVDMAQLKLWAGNRTSRFVQTQSDRDKQFQRNHANGISIAKYDWREENTD